MVPKNLTSCGKALRDNLYEKPLHLYWKLADKVAVLASTTQMTDGKLAAITFPMSIILRYGARAARTIVDKKNRRLSMLGAVPFSAMVAFSIFTALAAPAAALAGSAAAGAIIAGGVAAFALLPGLTLGTMALATAVGNVMAALAIIPASLNIPVGIQRSKVAIFGLNVDNDTPVRAAPAAPAPAPPPIDTEAATTLNSDMTFKKVKISFKKSAEQPEALAPGVKEFKPGDAIGTRKTIVL